MTEVVPAGGIESKRGRVLITGGAGFLGVNLAGRLLDEGTPVVVLDNLARPGADDNLRWLAERYPNLLRTEIADVRDRQALGQAVLGVATVYHFAAQTAVSASIADPTLDFDVNARGTLNLLEVLRALDTPPTLIFASSSKVYGTLSELPLREARRRYVLAGEAEDLRGIGESRPLCFQTPYGCSKGAADQYVLDAARTFGLPACALRLSCVFGPHQVGNPEQGWVTHFLKAALNDRRVTIFGDGKQVRDLLYIEDLVDALLLAAEKIDGLRGQAFNLGGGSANALSVLEVLALVEELRGATLTIDFGEWRAGDQRYYVSDYRAFARETGWRPQADLRTGLVRTYEWLAERRAAAIDLPVTATSTPPAARDNASTIGPPDE
ncbi:MAG TPA: NAD-dependent epimerase/dehydratase family protein [Opitutaceae bacterium]|nr:NAD-dependent epimerase/dehydratase family protein [Opitutaceae bacterium]